MRMSETRDTGQGTWDLMTDFTERRSAAIIRRKIRGHGYCRAEFFGQAVTRPCKLLLASRYPPFAAVSSQLADLPTSRFDNKFGRANLPVSPNLSAEWGV